jgi:hypothetical protein
MAVVLNVIFLVLLVGVATAVVSGLFAGIAYLFRVRRWYSWALGGPLIVVVFLLGYNRWASDPGRRFQNEFGFPAPPPVVIHHTHFRALGDSGEAFFHFTADAPTVRRIVAGWSEEDEFVSTTVEPPDWWQPRMSGTRQYFCRGGRGSASAKASPVPRNFASEDRWLIYDPTSGEVWYRFLGVD